MWKKILMGSVALGVLISTSFGQVAAAEAPETKDQATSTVFVTQQYDEANAPNMDTILEVDAVKLPDPKPKPKPKPKVVEEPVAETPNVDESEKTWNIEFPADAPTPDPGSAQETAKKIVTENGWDDKEYTCLYNLWNRESSWNYQALNSSSGAYGIPQSLPGEKMASHGADWATNPETQIRWGLDYIKDRYSTPCGAWAHSESVNWY